MPWVGARYMDEDEYADARYEAAQDAYDDLLERAGVACANGHRWVPKRVPATRTDPACWDDTECPYCGGEPIEEDD
jgi:hypothetical protein